MHLNTSSVMQPVVLMCFGSHLVQAPCYLRPAALLLLPFPTAILTAFICLHFPYTTCAEKSLILLYHGPLLPPDPCATVETLWPAGQSGHSTSLQSLPPLMPGQPLGPSVNLNLSVTLPFFSTSDWDLAGLNLNLTDCGDCEVIHKALIGVWRISIRLRGPQHSGSADLIIMFTDGAACDYCYCKLVPPRCYLLTEIN